MGFVHITKPYGARVGGHRVVARLAVVNEAGWWRRIAALGIDWVVALVTSALIADTAIPPDTITQNLIVCGFFIAEAGVLTGALGVSVGKRIVGIAVVNAQYRPIGVLRALLRTALICLVIPVLLITDRQRGLHDVVVGSIAIKS